MPRTVNATYIFLIRILILQIYDSFPHTQSLSVLCVYFRLYFFSLLITIITFLSFTLLSFTSTLNTLTYSSLSFHHNYSLLFPLSLYVNSFYFFLNCNNGRRQFLVRDVKDWLDCDLLTLTREREAGAAAGGSSPTLRVRSG